MSGSSRKRLAGVAIGSLVLAGGVTGIGVAQKGSKGSKGTIRADAVKQSRIAATKIARTIGRPELIRSAVFAARPPYGRVAGRSTKRLAGFPRAGNSFMLLSTGNVLLADNKNTSKSSGQNAGGPAIRGARDVTIMRLNITVPKGRNCLNLRFKFFTEEFPEFIGEEFNDAFVAELDRTTWDTRPVGDPSIDPGRNFATDADGNRISVNATGDANVKASRAKGTTYDGATRILRASTRVTPGGHKLYLSIFDQGDRQYDSAVFVDRLTYSKEKTCDNGAVLDKN